MQSIIELLVTCDKKASGLKSFDRELVSDKHKRLALHWSLSSHFVATMFNILLNNSPLKNQASCQILSVHQVQLFHLPTIVNFSKSTHLLNCIFSGFPFQFHPFFFPASFNDRQQGTNIRWQSTSPRAARDYARIPRSKAWWWWWWWHVSSRHSDTLLILCLHITVKMILHILAHIQNIIEL